MFDPQIGNERSGGSLQPCAQPTGIVLLRGGQISAQEEVSLGQGKICGERLSGIKEMVRVETF